MVRWLPASIIHSSFRPASMHGESGCRRKSLSETKCGSSVQEIARSERTSKHQPSGGEPSPSTPKYKDSETECWFHWVIAYPAAGCVASKQESQTGCQDAVSAACDPRHRGKPSFLAAKSEPSLLSVPLTAIFAERRSLLGRCDRRIEEAGEISRTRHQSGPSTL